jgi:DNA-binding MarR family transcriptional regulator
MARALGASQGAVSNALGRLVAGGLVQVERTRIRGRLYRAKVYHLTPQGEELVRRIREGAGMRPGEAF